MNKEIDEYLEKLQWSYPYNNEDIINAINFGKELLTKDARRAMIGMNVNGTCQNVLTEKKLEELIK